MPLQQCCRVAFVLLVGMASTTLPTPLYPYYQQHFGFELLMTTVIFSAYGIGVLGTLLLAGNLSDRTGRRPIMLTACLLGILSAFIFMAASGVGWLMLGRLVSGISAGLFTATATTQIVECAPPSYQSKAALLATLSNMVGLGIGPVISALTTMMLPAPGQGIFILDTVLLLIATALVWRTNETAPSLPNSGPLFHIRCPYVPHYLLRPFIPAAVAGFAGFAVMGIFTSAVPNVMGQLMGIHIPLAIGAMALLIFFGSALGQTGQQRLPPASRLPIGATLLALGMALIGISVGLIAPVLLAVGGIIAGIGQGIALRAGLGEMTRLSRDEDRASVTSMFFLILYLASVIPVIGLGLTAHAIGLQLAGTLFSAAIGGLALAALMALFWLSAHPDQHR